MKGRRQSSDQLHLDSTNRMITIDGASHERREGRSRTPVMDLAMLREKFICPTREGQRSRLSAV